MSFDPHQRRWMVAISLILVVFGGAGLLRLNSFCLLEPDSPDYLFTSRALVTLQGYVEIDHPDRPPHAFRPPGLPLLLAPVTAVSPGNVVSAKLFLLCVSLVALLLVALAAWRVGGPAAGSAVLLLVATGPYTLLHATEVVSEMPYLAALLATWWLALRDREPTRAANVSMALLLALLPLLRTVGLIWLLALMGHTVLTRSRRWRIPIVFALLVNATWMLRNQRMGVVTYFSGMAHDYRELGVGGYLAKSFDAAAFYFRSLFDVLLPGVFSGPPLYERFLLEPAPTLGGLWGVGYLLGSLVLVLAIAGCVARWREGGAIVLSYAAGFVAVLLVYPPRHERLIWPLVPLVWIYAPAGAVTLATWAARRSVPRRLRRSAAVVGVLLLVVLVTWQATATWASVRVNRDWLGDRSGFHARTVPPMYYADWNAAGSWLSERAAGDGARVLTRHSDIGFTSGLQQDSVRFEEISPTELHRRIAALTPRYLALPATRFRWLAPSYLLTGSPVYRFEPVYESGDVLLVQVLPNRDGVVHRRSPGLDRRLAECRAAAERLPLRADLQRRLGQLLHEAGRTDEALTVLSALESAEGLLTVGRMQLDLGDGRAALDAYERARTAPGAQALAGTIARGAANARRVLEVAQWPVERRVRHHLERAGTFMQSLLFAEAWRALERAETLAPRDLQTSQQVAFVRALLLERTGSYEEAEAQFATLASQGFQGAAEADTLRRERLLMRGEVTAPAETWLGLAANRAGNGLIGRALALLEQAATQHPQSAELRQRLGDLQRFYDATP